MKNLYIFIITAFMSLLNINAQAIDVVTGLDEPTRIALNGNHLFFAQHSKISKINITEETPLVTDVIDVNEPNGFGLIFNENDLYISKTADGVIFKIDITEITPTLIDVVTGLDFPNKFVLNGNDLYFSQSLIGKISKIDITETSPTVIDVIDGLNLPNGMVLNGDDLYITEFNGNKISKIDITQTNPTAIDVVDGLNKPVALALNNNDLYIAEFLGNKISKIDITEATPNIVDIVTGLNEPIDLIFYGNDLFISERGGNKISKLENIILSTNEFLSNSKATLYPNPSNTYIQVSGLIKTENYKIYNAIGTEVLIGTTSNNEKINIENLANGLYLLAFENRNTFKFIKI